MQIDREERDRQADRQIKTDSQSLVLREDVRYYLRNVRLECLSYLEMFFEGIIIVNALSDVKSAPPRLNFNGHQIEVSLSHD